MASKDCPKCGADNSLAVSNFLKYGKITKKWQHVLVCNACIYEGKAK